MKKIKLTQNKYTLVDKDDFKFLNQFKWHVFKGRKTFYARTWRNGKHVFMHRLILSPSNDMQIDHINNNGLDNRKLNLRKCSQRENLLNRGSQINNKIGLKGVYHHSTRKKWCANIKINKKTIYLGWFDLIEDAVNTYNNAAKKYFGEFAYKGQNMATAKALTI